MITYSSRNAKVRLNGVEVPVSAWEVTAPPMEMAECDDRVIVAKMSGYVSFDSVLFESITSTQKLTITAPGIARIRSRKHVSTNLHNRRWRRRSRYYDKSKPGFEYVIPNAIVSYDGNEIVVQAVNSGAMEPIQ